MKVKVAALLTSALLFSGAAFAEEEKPMAVTLLDSANLIGSPVENDANEAIADIEKFLIDQDGQIRFVILGTGGFLDLGEKLVAVPWQSLKFATKTVEGEEINILQLKDGEAMLADAPAYTKENLDELTSTEGNREVYAFWGVEPPVDRALRQMKKAGEDAGEALSKAVEDVKERINEESKESPGS